METESRVKELEVELEKLKHERAEAAESRVSVLTKALEKLVTGKELNGYPLWFNRQVAVCPHCDSEDLCNRHLQYVQEEYEYCGEQVKNFIESLNGEGR